MNQNNKDTEDILDAIKSMMSNDQFNSEQNLAKDIIELTKPIDEKQINESESSILELTELVIDEAPDETVTAEANELQISEGQIRNVVRSTIDSLPEETINNIINEELKRVVLERLSSCLLYTSDAADE